MTYKEINVTDEIKIRRLRWAGHVQKMDVKWVLKKIMEGFAIVEWEEGVGKDSKQLLHINIWRRKEDRKKWRQRLKEAKAQNGM